MKRINQRPTILILKVLKKGQSLKNIVVVEETHKYISSKKRASAYIN